MVDEEVETSRSVTVREIPYGPEGHVGGSRSRVARYCVCIEYNESQSVLATHRAAKQRELPLTTVVGA